MLRADFRAPNVTDSLLHTRYSALANNTIDYWMLPDESAMTETRINRAIEHAPVFPDSTLQLYLHVPFCAQRCRFCAFSGGNDLDFKQAERYCKLVVKQMNDLVGRSGIKGHPIRSVNIGGGSPDLVGEHIRLILEAVHALPGFNEQTELAVEFTLSTTKREFIDELVRFGVTKASFGIQSLDPEVRHHMRQPKKVLKYDRVLDWIDGRIPIVNADLITGLPGQNLQTVFSDLQGLMDDPRINAISSYLLTPGAAPALLAALDSGVIPSMPDHHEQALMRLHTYSTFLREGWVRRGTNTYVDPARIPSSTIDQMAGNECIGAAHYEDFLLGVGPQAISFLPGARVENHVDIKKWAAAIDSGDSPFHLPKCSDVAQRDTALWVFPLRWEGLAQDRYDKMVESGALTDRQINFLGDLESEGLVVHNDDGYQLSLIGEVFMGRLVRDLKQGAGQQAVDEYIAEGHALGKAMSEGLIVDDNAANNRQQIELSVDEGA